MPPKYYNGTPGYFMVRHKYAHFDKYYILNMTNLRKPVLLRLACSSRFNAKRYIMLKTKAKYYEVISGADAIERNIPFSKKLLDRSSVPERYDYPRGLDWSKKKQHRTKVRKRIREYLNSVNCLKQFTLKYRKITYTTFCFTISEAFRLFQKYTGISWNLFIKLVSNEVREVTRKMRFIKSTRVNIVMINHFLKQHSVGPIKYAPHIGTVYKLEEGYLLTHKNKPYQLNF